MGRSGSGVRLSAVGSRLESEEVARAGRIGACPPDAGVRQKITSGEWPINSKIPTEPELMRLLGVGKTTVREAVRSLASLGVLEPLPGIGTFVRSRMPVSTKKGVIKVTLKKLSKDTHTLKAKFGGNGQSLPAPRARPSSGSADAPHPSIGPCR